MSLFFSRRPGNERNKTPGRAIMFRSIVVSFFSSIRFISSFSFVCHYKCIDVYRLVPFSPSSSLDPTNRAGTARSGSFVFALQKREFFSFSFYFGRESFALLIITSLFLSFFSPSKAGDKQSGLGSNGRSFNDGSRDGARDRRSGTGSGSDSFGEADRRAGYTPPYEEELDRYIYPSVFNNK